MRAIGGLLMVCAACSGGGSSSDSCPWSGAWVGTLSYSWTTPQSSTGSSAAHVAFTVGACGPTYPDFDMSQYEITAGTIDVAGFGSFVQMPAGMHLPITLPAPDNQARGQGDYDWYLYFDNGHVETDSRSGQVHFAQIATGLEITQTDPSFAWGEGGPSANPLLDGLPPSTQIVYTDLELHQTSGSHPIIDGGSVGDGSPPDATTTAPDAPACYGGSVPCGSTTCDGTTQYCREVDSGGTSTYTCQPLPGCVCAPTCACVSSHILITCNGGTSCSMFPGGGVYFICSN